MEPDESRGSDEREVEVALNGGRPGDLGVLGGMAGGVGRRGGRGDPDHLRAARRLDREVRSRHSPEGDVRRLQLQHRCGVTAGIEREPQWHAPSRVPGKLGVAQQAAVVLRRDLHGVCGVAGDVARDGAREVDVLRQLVQVGLDLADRWQRLVPRARALGVGTGRDRALVDGVGAGVVDPEVATRDHRLSVAVVGLELQSELVRAGREPHATRAALQQRVGALLEAEMR